jgi:hypothetical protein
MSDYEERRMSTSKQAACWRTFEAVLEAGIDRVILYGPSGTGKTYTALTHDVPAGGAFRLICTEDMTSADVAGCFMPAKDGFEYLDGAALRAWKGNGVAGGRLVIDEIDRASGDVLSQLLAFTDSAKSATFLHPVTGEEHRPLPGFSVIMTTNLEDPDDLAPALRDRFPVALKIDKAHEDGLATLPNDLRPAAEALVGASGGRNVSLRTFYAFDALRTRMGQEEAAKLVFGPEKAESLLDALSINNVEVGRLDLFVPPASHPLEGASYGLASESSTVSASAGRGLEIEL